MQVGTGRAGGWGLDINPGPPGLDLQGAHMGLKPLGELGDLGLPPIVRGLGCVTRTSPLPSRACEGEATRISGEVGDRIENSC